MIDYKPYILYSIIQKLNTVHTNIKYNTIVTKSDNYYNIIYCREVIGTIKLVKVNELTYTMYIKTSDNITIKDTISEDDIMAEYDKVNSARNHVDFYKNESYDDDENYMSEYVEWYMDHND